MDKPQFLVIGILAVALGFFALRFTADGPGDYESASGSRGEEYASLDGGEGPSRSGQEGRLGGTANGREGGPAAGGRASRFGRSSTGGNGPGASGGRGGAETVAGGARDRDGNRIGGHSGLRAANQVGRTASGSISSNSLHRDHPASGATSRSDRVEMLTGKETEIDPFYDAANLDDDPNDDVLLEVKSKDDIDRKAEVLEDVEASDDGEWLEVGENATLTFPDLGNANSKEGTVTLDIVPNWNGSDITDNSFMQIREAHEWENRMQLVKNGEFLRFIVTDSTGHEADISYKIGEWQEGDAHNVTATWDEGVTTLYVDGKRVGTNTYPGELNFKPTTPLYLASDRSDGSYNGANAKVGNFKIFGTAKTPDDNI